MATQTRWLKVTSTVTNQTPRVQSFFSFCNHFNFFAMWFLWDWFWFLLDSVLGFFSSGKCCFGSFWNAISSLCLGM